MKILDTSPEIVALGEGLVEFAALERGRPEQVTTFRRGCGGDTSNFVVAAARLGASAGYITRVGDDDFGRAVACGEGPRADAVDAGDDAVDLPQHGGIEQDRG